MSTIVEPARIARLPHDRHGRPVPWFVAWIDGQPDHRIARADRHAEAIRWRLCWVCGQTLGSNVAFVLGPMCVVNRTTAEPPAHRDCAVYSALACPFLSTPTMRRRESGKPEGVFNPGGEMICRNPGVTAVWVTRANGYTVFNPGNGHLFCLVGEPTEVAWYTHSRAATRDEVMAAIDAGLPTLRAAADTDGPAAHAQLDRDVAAALRHVPGPA